MPRNCVCGGRWRRYNMTDTLLSHWYCDKCRRTTTQHLRQSKKAKADHMIIRIEMKDIPGLITTDDDKIDFLRIIEGALNKDGISFESLALNNEAMLVPKGTDMKVLERIFGKDTQNG